jgi:hypothetical protein
VELYHAPSSEKVDVEGAIESGGRGRKSIEHTVTGSGAGALLGGIFGGGKGAGIGSVIGDLFLGDLGCKNVDSGFGNFQWHKLSGAALCIGSRFEDTDYSFHIGLLFLDA